MAIYGYLRVINKEDCKKLEQAGAEKIFIEKYEELKSEGMVELGKLISIVKQGDQVLVTNFEQLARNVIELDATVTSLNNLGISITFLDNIVTFASKETE